VAASPEQNSRHALMNNQPPRHDEPENGLPSEEIDELFS